MITQEQLDKVTAERDSALAQVKALEGSTQTKVEEAVKAHDSKLADRVSVRVQAVQADGTKDKVITKLAMDSTKGDREVMLAVITSKDPDFKADGKSDEYIRVRFDLAVQDKGQVRQDSAAKQDEAAKVAALAAGGSGKEIINDGNRIERARLAMVKNNQGLALGGKQD